MWHAPPHMISLRRGRGRVKTLRTGYGAFILGRNLVLARGAKEHGVTGSGVARQRDALTIR